MHANIYAINFDRAQILTESGANIVDVQLSMDFKNVLRPVATPMKNDGDPTWGRDPQVGNR